jgi:hypothetical protein
VEHAAHVQDAELGSHPSLERPSGSLGLTADDGPKLGDPKCDHSTAIRKLLATQLVDPPAQPCGGGCQSEQPSATGEVSCAEQKLVKPRASTCRRA